MVMECPKTTKGLTGFVDLGTVNYGYAASSPTPRMAIPSRARRLTSCAALPAGPWRSLPVSRTRPRTATFQATASVRTTPAIGGNDRELAKRRARREHSAGFSYFTAARRALTMAVRRRPGLAKMSA